MIIIINKKLGPRMNVTEFIDCLRDMCWTCLCIYHVYENKRHTKFNLSY